MLANVGKCRRMYRVRPKQVGKCRRMYRVRPIFKNDHFGEYSNSTKMANFWRVLEFDKFDGEWPLLSNNTVSKICHCKELKIHAAIISKFSVLQHGCLSEKLAPFHNNT
jgi:hypothetical protein